MMPAESGANDALETATIMTIQTSNGYGSKFTEVKKTNSILLSR